MGLTDQVQDLVTTIESTRQAITAHDVELPPGSGLHAFPAAIAAIQTAPPAVDNSFPFPSDYPDITDGYTPGTFRGLVLLDPVDDGNNVVSFSVAASGGYRVAWGDGSTEETFSSGVTCSHNFLWANGGPILSDGNRVLTVTVTPVSGPITALDLAKLPDPWFPYAGRNSIWLDVAVDIPGLTYFGLGQHREMIKHGVLRRVARLNTSAMVDVGALFMMCTALVVIPDVLDFSAAISAQDVFNSCISLARVPDVLDFSSATVVSGAFANTALKSLPAVLNFSSATVVDSLFSNSRALVQLPDNLVFGSAVTSAVDLFTYCASLTRVPVATGLTVSTSVRHSAMGFVALNTFFEGLGTANPGATVDIRDTPGRAIADTPIATNKGWTVLT